MKNKLMKIILQIFLTITGIACIPTLIVNAADSMERTYQPAGLCNLGNTCYMNATLQALLNDKELVGYTLTAPESDINKVNRLGSGGRVFAAFKALCQQYVSSNGIAVKPDEFKRIFGNFYALFDDYNQHDASECLISVLDALHEDLNQSDVAKGFMTRKHANDTLGGMPLHYACNKSPIVDIYHGVQHTDFTCPDCHHTSSKDEALINWDLNISSTSTTNLNDCIDLYSRSEILAPGEEWNCENCGRLVRATKTVSIKKLASRITIQLKRFSQTPTGGLVKNPAPVIYPVEFDASKYAVNAGSYELNSIICHFGTLNGGHYISYVKNNGQWFRCDDSSVTLVSEKEALSQTSAAYVLLYSKKPIDFQTTDIPLNTTTPLATDVPPAKPFLITQPVVVKPVSTVQQRPVAKPSFSLSSGIPDEETLEVFRVYNPNNGMHHYT
ncbi:MAG: hypothetical protein LBL38_01495, partial [Lactobacillales bacterium]|nr:hypothetical protein [Lactobacillales bacterium]